MTQTNWQVKIKNGKDGNMWQYSLIGNDLIIAQ